MPGASDAATPAAASRAAAACSHLPLLPLPPRPAPALQLDAMAGGGLRNEDFRKLLATPRPGAGGGGGGGGEGDKQKKAKKPGRNYRPGGKPGAKEDEEDEGPKYRCAGGGDCSSTWQGSCTACAVAFPTFCGSQLSQQPGAQPANPRGTPPPLHHRDRAAERRKGLSTEFEGVPDDLVGLLEGKVSSLFGCATAAFAHFFQTGPVWLLEEGTASCPFGCATAA